MRVVPLLVIVDLLDARVVLVDRRHGAARRRRRLRLELFVKQLDGAAVGDLNVGDRAGRRAVARTQALVLLRLLVELSHRAFAARMLLGELLLTMVVNLHADEDDGGEQREHDDRREDHPQVFAFVVLRRLVVVGFLRKCGDFVGVDEFGLRAGFGFRVHNRAVVHHEQTFFSRDGAHLDDVAFLVTMRALSYADTSSSSVYVDAFPSARRPSYVVERHRRRSRQSVIDSDYQLPPHIGNSGGNA